MRCPICKREGTLDPRGQDRQVSKVGMSWGVQQPASGERVCPNPRCRALIYVVYIPSTSEVLASYPPELLDFDASQLPDRVKTPLEEAVTCHSSECFPAAAVMVRRALEEVCADQEAEGDNLYERIEALAESIVLPKGMIEALHNLRLLGNDAVHVKARVYAEVGKEEVEIAIEVAKTILHATYQMDTLLGQLEGLKTPAAEAEAAD